MQSLIDLVADTRLGAAKDERSEGRSNHGPFERFAALKQISLQTVVGIYPNDDAVLRLLKDRVCESYHFFEIASYALEVRSGRHFVRKKATAKLPIPGGMDVLTVLGK